MTVFRPVYILLLSALTLVLAACGTTGGQSAGAREATPDAVTQMTSAYALGSSDRLRVTVFGHPDLSGEFEVDGIFLARLVEPRGAVAHAAAHDEGLGLGAGGREAARHQQFVEALLRS